MTTNMNNLAKNPEDIFAAPQIRILAVNLIARVQGLCYRFRNRPIMFAYAGRPDMMVLAA